jgi:cytochrome c biogenesis protein CcmG/thiol:disulfide interchange protein DsbE
MEEKMKIKYFYTFVPFILFVLLFIFLWQGLGKDPRKIVSPLIGKAFPTFEATNLMSPYQKINNDIFKGKVTLLNVFASWCSSCLSEHSVMMEASKVKNLSVYGLDYKDDKSDANLWLKENGNPFEKIINDSNGDIAINLGVYGTPETFLIDQQGVIRYKHLGPISPESWSDGVYPMILKLQTGL